MQELDPYQELNIQRQEMLARKAGQARDILQKLRDAFNSFIINARPWFITITKLVDKFADWAHRNNDLEKVLKTKLLPRVQALTKHLKPLIGTVKFVVKNWKELLFVFGAWKALTAGAWAAGIIRDLVGVARAAEGAAA